MDTTWLIIQIFVFVVFVLAGYFIPLHIYRKFIIALIITGVILGSVLPLKPNKFLLEVFLVISLVFLIFYLSSYFRFKEIDSLEWCALRLGSVTFVLCSLVTGMVAWFLFEQNLYYAAVLGLIIIATDPQTINTSKAKIMNLERFESAFKSIVAAILIFLFVTMGNELGPFDLNINGVEGIVVGLGIGLVMSLIYFKASEKLKGPFYYLATVLFAILVFLTARLIESNGTMAVAVIGFLFANMHIKGRKELRILARDFARFFIIPVFFITAFFVEELFKPEIMLNAFILFVLYLLTRFIILNLFNKELPLKLEEKIYMTLNNPHGSTGILAILALMVYQPSESVLISTILLILIYSLVTSTIIDNYIKWRF